MRRRRTGRSSLFAGGRKRALPAVAVGAVLVFAAGAVFLCGNRPGAGPGTFFGRRGARGTGNGRIARARAYLDQKKLPEAEALLIEALEEDPQDPAAYDLLGSVYYRMNRKTDAEATWRNGLSIDGRFAGFYVNLGALEAEKGNVEEALFFFREAAKRDARSPALYEKAATACYNAGRYREALAYWEEAKQRGAREDPVISKAMEKARRQLAATDI